MPLKANMLAFSQRTVHMPLLVTTISPVLLTAGSAVSTTSSAQRIEKETESSSWTV